MYFNLFFFPASITFRKSSSLTSRSSMKSNQPNLILLVFCCFTSYQLIITAILPAILLSFKAINKSTSEFLRFGFKSLLKLLIS